MAITIDELNRTLSEDADVLLTAATSADMIKLEQIKAVADGNPQGSPSLIFAPLINSFLNVRGEVSVMLTGVPLDTSDPQNPVYDAVGQRGLDLVLASGLVIGSGNHPSIALGYDDIYTVGETANFLMTINDGTGAVVVADWSDIQDASEFSTLIEGLSGSLSLNYSLEWVLSVHSVTEAPLLFVVNNSDLEYSITITYEHGNPPQPKAMLEVLDDPNLSFITANPTVETNPTTGTISFSLTAGNSEAP